VCECVVSREQLTGGKASTQHPGSTVAHPGDRLQTPATGRSEGLRTVESSVEEKVPARQPVCSLPLRSFVCWQVLVVGIW
jgi:hypothetical protein